MGVLHVVAGRSQDNFGILFKTEIPIASFLVRVRSRVFWDIN